MQTINRFTFILFLIYFIIELAGEARWANKEGKPPKYDKKSFVILHLAILIFLPIGAYLGIRGQSTGWARVDWGFPYLSYLGLVLMLLGIVMRALAKAALQNQFTTRVAFEAGYKVIDSGMYAYIRHPAYLGNLMFYFGIGIALANWASAFVIGLPVLAAHLYRISVEEKVLLDKMGPAYVAYSKKTKRIIPLVY